MRWAASFVVALSQCSVYFCGGLPPFPTMVLSVRPCVFPTYVSFVLASAPNAAEFRTEPAKLQNTSLGIKQQSTMGLSSSLFICSRVYVEHSAAR